ncbi:MAG TPA: hypothetical protein PLZ57_07540 [Pseudobdellovibrionaceae bacterium]|nr:hypothetical protein [Pseudobdellovibrionaceae bacterium]
MRKLHVLPAMFGLIVAMSMIESKLVFANQATPAPGQSTAAEPKSSPNPQSNKTVLTDEYEEDPPPPPRSIHELYKHCYQLKFKDETTVEVQNRAFFDCKKEALCEKNSDCLLSGKHLSPILDLSLAQFKIRGALAEHAKFIVFYPEDVSRTYVPTEHGLAHSWFTRTDPRKDPGVTGNGLPGHRWFNTPAERVPFEFKFRGQTYEADSLSVIGPLFDFELRDGFLELPNFAVHEWFVKNFKPDEFRVIQWGAYYPRRPIAEIWPYRNPSKREETASFPETETVDFYLGNPWVRVINTYFDGWWVDGSESIKPKFKPEELPAVEAYFIKLKKEKKFCQVTLKPGTVIRADGAFQTKDPEHIKILKLPKKGLPPLVWCPEAKKGCKCKWEQPPGTGYFVPTGSISAFGDEIVEPKTAKKENWPD